MTPAERRARLVRLQLNAPSGVDQLMACVVAMNDRWELLDAMRALEDALQWANATDLRWRAQAFAVLAMMCADMADAELENAVLDTETKPRN